MKLRMKISKLRSWLWILLIGFVSMGWLVDRRFGFVALICMAAPVLFAVFKGRYWCGWFCPRGSFFDNLIKRVSLNRDIPSIMLKPWFRGLVFAVLMAGMVAQLWLAGGDLVKTGTVILQLITVTTMVGIFLGVLIHPRSWCVVCPMGSLATFFGKGKYQLEISSTCIGCKKCSKACPVQIAPIEFRPKTGEVNIITNPNCLKCEKCIDVCPKKALSLPKAV